MKFLENAELSAIESQLDGRPSFHSSSTLRCKIELYSCKAAGVDKKLEKLLDEKFLSATVTTGISPPSTTSHSFLTSTSSTGSNSSASSSSSSSSSLAAAASASGYSSSSCSIAHPSYSNANNSIYSAAASSSGNVNALYGTSPFGPLMLSSSRKTLIYLISTLNASYPDYDFANLRPDDFEKQVGVEAVRNTVACELVGNFITEDEAHSLWSAADAAVQCSECDVYAFSTDDAAFGIEDDGIWSYHYFFYNKAQKKVLYLALQAVDAHERSRELIDDDDIDDKDPYASQRSFGFDEDLNESMDMD
eukprot:ANDGO_07491.mRNA.1 Repressor of RNA polymerase III transcription